MAKSFSRYWLWLITFITPSVASAVQLSALQSAQRFETPLSCKVENHYHMLNDDWMVSFLPRPGNPGATIETLFLRNKVKAEFNSLLADFRVYKVDGQMAWFFSPYFVGSEQKIRDYRYITLAVDETPLVKQSTAISPQLTLSYEGIEKIKAGNQLAIFLDDQFVASFRLKGSRKALETSATLFSEWSALCP